MDNIREALPLLDSLLIPFSFNGVVKSKGEKPCFRLSLPKGLEIVGEEEF